MTSNPNIPLVSSNPLGVCTLELKRLGLQNESEMQNYGAKIIQALAPFYLEAKVGIAATPELALLDARNDDLRSGEHGGRDTNGLPVAALEPAPEIAVILSRWGIRTVGQLLALGKSAVAERLGPDAIELFERFSEGSVRPLKLISPPETFSEQTEFEHEVETAGPLIFVLRRFVEQLSQRLKAIYLVAGHSGAKKLLEERHATPFASLDDFKRRVRLNKDELRTLAEIGALNCFANHRRDALWEVERPVRQDDLFESGDARGDLSSPLEPMNYAERIQCDFAGMNLTTGKHPMALLRPRLRDIWRATDLPKVTHGSRVRIAGNVICRQRPGTAKGFVFISLEDETGVSNAIVTPPMFEANRLLITEESFLVIEGRLQHVENVIHVKAEKIERLEHGEFAGSQSYDFR